MKHKILFILIAAIIFSCKKSSYNSAMAVGSLTIFNAAADIPSINPSFKDTAIPNYLYKQPISYGSWYEYGIPAGKLPIYIRTAIDTSNQASIGNFDLVAGGIYSLYYLGGASKGDFVFQQDTIPVFSDSLSGIRFIILCSGVDKVSINLAGNSPDLVELNGLGYKQISAFKSYKVSSDVAAYNFEIRDNGTKELLATFSWNCTLYKSNTIAICGNKDLNGTNSIQAFQINNY
jgi:hypothetical protein